jgi:hypothetical protein
MLETSSHGPAVLQSFLDPRAHRAHPPSAPLSGAAASGPALRIPQEVPNGTGEGEGEGESGEGQGRGLDDLPDRVQGHVDGAGGVDIEIGAADRVGAVTHNPHMPYNPALGTASTLLNGSHADLAYHDVLREESVGFGDAAGAGGSGGGGDGDGDEEQKEEGEGESEEESEEARPPMLVATVVAPKYTAAREARRAAARLERMGGEFQRRWVEEKVRNEESEADEEEEEEEEEEDDG